MPLFSSCCCFYCSSFRTHKPYAKRTTSGFVLQPSRSQSWANLFQKQVLFSFSWPEIAQNVNCLAWLNLEGLLEQNTLKFFTVLYTFAHIFWKQTSSFSMRMRLKMSSREDANRTSITLKSCPFFLPFGIKTHHFGQH